MPHSLRLLLGMPHPCSYLEEQTASDLFIDPKAPMNTLIYSQLAEQGFRRSGSHIYRPHCSNCSQCKPVRLVVDKFIRSRQQRRTWNKNRDLSVTTTTTPDRAEHLALFGRYVSSRHRGGGMDEFEEEGPFEFFQGEWSETLFYEFRDPQYKLIAVAVCDLLLDGLSAVYSYFEPEQASRSLGVMCVLWQIEQAKQMSHPYLYLGYWIAASRKMKYKSNYQPLEWFDQPHWRPLEP